MKTRANHPADFKAALDALLRSIETDATRKFIHNEKTNVPSGILPPEESIPNAIRSGVASAVNAAADWDCQNAVECAHAILEDANCHDHARALREVDTQPPNPLLQIVKDLLEWEGQQGGFEAPAWQRARAAIRPDPAPPEPDPGEYIRPCPSCGEIEGMEGSIYLEPGGDARCDCCGLIWGSV